MAKFRVEVEEQTTTTRETWIEADTEEDARDEAEGQDWRTWSTLETRTDASIAFIEEVES